MLDWLTKFWIENSNVIIISFAAGFIFFVLGPLGVWFSGKKIRKERIRKAKEALLDLLEGMIVSQSNINENKMIAMYRAVERDIDIDLSNEYNLENWLGDVAFRFEKSRHLGPDQKQKYYDEVSRINNEIKNNRSQKKEIIVPRKYETIFSELNETLSDSENSKATSLVAELERRMTENPFREDPFLNIFRMYVRIFKKSPVMFIVTAIISVVFYIYFIIKIF